MRFLAVIGSHPPPDKKKKEKELESTLSAQICKDTSITVALRNAVSFYESPHPIGCPAAVACALLLVPCDESNSQRQDRQCTRGDTRHEPSAEANCVCYGPYVIQVCLNYGRRSRRNIKHCLLHGSTRHEPRGRSGYPRTGAATRLRYGSH